MNAIDRLKRMAQMIQNVDIKSQQCELVDSDNPHFVELGLMINNLLIESTDFLGWQ